MSETNMPAAEAMAVEQGSDERFAYELAFHVLPTVAEGEVPAVYDEIKAAVTATGAEIFDEEAPARFDLAYEIEKHLEGKNRKFKSAYFGWVRFRVETDKIEDINEAMDGNTKILRHLLLRLTRVEEEHPFRFHEALAQDEKKVEDIEDSEVTKSEAVREASKAEEDEATTEETKDADKAEETVNEKELDEALDKKEV